jgi:hypothetical protein
MPEVRGWQRAGALGVLFGSAELAQSRGLSVPQHLYASAPEKTYGVGSHSLRSEQTLVPLAQRLGHTICLDWIKGQETGLAKDVLRQTGIVLVAWQHEDIPIIAAAIPGGNISETRTWADDRFDLVWIFDLLLEGTYSFKEIRQGLLSGDLDI